MRGSYPMAEYKLTDANSKSLREALARAHEALAEAGVDASAAWFESASDRITWCEERLDELVTEATELLWEMREALEGSSPPPRPDRISGWRWVAGARCSLRDGGWNCRYCGAALDADNWHLEHLTPLVRGGSNRLDNLGLSCAGCNLSKGALTEAEFRGRGERKGDASR